MYDSIIFMGLYAIPLLLKAVLEKFYFKESKAAKKTLRAAFQGLGILIASFCFSLLLNYAG